MRFMTCFAMAACLALPAYAEGPRAVPGLAPFNMVELHHDGLVEIRHGADRTVTLVAGDRWESTFTVTPDGRLVIHGCKACGDRFRVLVTIPRPEGLAVLGGGRIRVAAGYPRQDSVALKVVDGGTVEATNLKAGQVTARVTDAGRIEAAPIDGLVASVSGAGEITYTGAPPSVVVSRSGQGVVRPAR